MKVVGLVPIKLNNERMPNKNILPFDGGKPLISYILDTLISIKKIDDIYVYCSSKEIKKFLPKGVSFLQRDPVLDLATTPFNKILTSFAEKVYSDIYVLTHATAPFITAKSIEFGIEMVIGGEYDSALAVTKLNEFIWKNGKPFNYDIENIPRTQDLEPIYKETCGLYVYNRELITQKGRRIGDKPFLVEVSKIEAIDINDADDFALANAIFQSKFKEKMAL
ncbi:MAG TPA: acylneuraminate cytidylyltransferase family protein [Clostridiales bacterium]|jgi:CMP-N-acetylneuraminic acid synthetase|nr:acylneuraminate cytidylyltransferase family protein [Clostridiales bacterium]